MYSIVYTVQYTVVCSAQFRVLCNIQCTVVSSLLCTHCAAALYRGYFVLLTDWTLAPLHSTLHCTAVVIGQMSGANNVNKAGNSLGDLWLITHITPITLHIAASPMCQTARQESNHRSTLHRHYLRKLEYVRKELANSVCAVQWIGATG